jgi:hypothetical protein
LISLGRAYPFVKTSSAVASLACHVNVVSIGVPKSVGC